MFKIILRALLLLKERKFIITSLTFANIVFVSLLLVEPIFFKEVIDILIGFEEDSSQNYNRLVQTLILWVIVGIITIGTRLYVSIYSDRLAHQEFDKNVFRFFNHTIDLAMRFHTNSNPGKLIKKITKGVDGIFMLQLNFFRRVTPGLLTLIILIPVVLYFNWKLGLFVVISGTVSACTAFYLSSYTFRRQREIETVYDDMSSHYGDTFGNMPVVKSFTLFQERNTELVKLTDDRIQKQFPILTFWGLIISITQILKIIVSIGVIFFGSYLFLEGEITVGEIVMFLTFSMILLSTVEDLMWNLEEMFWRFAGIRDYFEILDTEVEIQDIPGAKSLKKVKGNISFQDITFSYDNKRDVLQNVNFEVKSGEKIAFVGHTGSGKTTTSNLILRFFEPQQGKILIDDQDISKVTQQSLRENIGVVFQDNSLFNTTILNNIKLDNIKATKKDIDRVAQKSHASDFIKNLSDGLDTVVGERGVKLSGGEKQRLAIARAFLKDAPILILDEATSALDAETEKYLQGSFDELMEGRTTFIIAHRLSTIRKADRIFVFKDGKIVESGDYNSLYKQKGIFTKLVDTQTQGFIE